MNRDTLYREVFGYDRQADLAEPGLINWNGIRVPRDDSPRGNSSAFRLNTSVVLSEMGERARLAYGALGLSPTVTDEERKWGMPDGTFFAQSAERSRRSCR